MEAGVAVWVRDKEGGSAWLSATLVSKVLYYCDIFLCASRLN